MWDVVMVEKNLVKYRHCKDVVRGLGRVSEG